MVHTTDIQLIHKSRDAKLHVSLVIPWLPSPTSNYLDRASTTVTAHNVASITSGTDTEGSVDSKNHRSVRSTEQ